ncbi:MAG: hypothetical protein ACIAXF_16515 [Phycisphaerales bacterium JB063]
MKQACFICLLGLAVLPGCGATPNKLSSQNDELRRSNMELERAVDELSEQLAMRERELAAMRAADGQSPVDGVEAPRLAGIELDRLTGVLPSADDTTGGRELRVYLRPVDQDGRLITVAGSARLRLVYTPAEGDPVTLVDQRYDTDQFHAAYRDGITGTHYTLEANLSAESIEQGAATLHVALTDAATGRVYTAQRVVALSR